MNRVVRQLHRRRCALKNHQDGGGLAVASLTPFSSSNGVPIESRAYTEECYDQFRPGEIRAQPHPELAQTPMAGGSGRNRKSGGGCGCMRGGGSCGRVWMGGRRTRRQQQRGGVCPCAMRQRGGSRSRRYQRGGSKGGFGVDPSLNVGGNGPIAAAANVPVPCDVRAANPFATNGLGADPRAAVGYSLTPNNSAPIGLLNAQRGGGALLQGYDYTPADGKQYVDTRVSNFAYSATQAGGQRLRSRRGGQKRSFGGSYGGNTFGASCYRAPGSEMPVYPAQTAGFDFSPSTAAGASYSDGVTPFMEVNPVAARMGGGRKYRSRKHRSRKHRSRKH